MSKTKVTVEYAVRTQGGKIIEAFDKDWAKAYTEANGGTVVYRTKTVSRTEWSE